MLSFTVLMETVHRFTVGLKAFRERLTTKQLLNVSRLVMEKRHPYLKGWSGKLRQFVTRFIMTLISPTKR